MKRILALLTLGTAFISGHALAAPIVFSGPLRIISEDIAGRYSGTPLETIFSGEIDDTTFGGFITDGTTPTTFSCCMGAADSPNISNDVMLDMDLAMTLNTIAGENAFSAGEIVDLVDLEGDTMLPGATRIEVGLSFVLDGDTYPNSDPANYEYPFPDGSVRLAVYFIVEENEGITIYDVIGKANIIPVPAAVWLFGSALGVLGWLRRRAQTDATE